MYVGLCFFFDAHYRRGKPLRCRFSIKKKVSQEVKVELQLHGWGEGATIQGGENERRKQRNVSYKTKPNPV